jgi:hypothetical protein
MLFLFIKEQHYWYQGEVDLYLQSVSCQYFRWKDVFYITSIILLYEKFDSLPDEKEKKLFTVILFLLYSVASQIDQSRKAYSRKGKNASNW